MTLPMTPPLGQPVGHASGPDAHALTTTRSPRPRPGAGDRVARTSALRLLLWRLHRPAAAICVALAALFTVSAIRNSGPPTTPVLVAARDLSAGVTITSADLSLRLLPTATLPDGTTGDSAALLGTRTTAAVPTGLPLVAGLLTDTIATGPPGTVVVPVRFADPDAAALLAPGSRIDVVSAPVGAEPHTVADDALVLATPEDGSGGGLLDDDSGLLLVAVDPAQAVQLAAANASASLCAILVE